MINIDKFTKRLQMLLDYYHLTASAFADSIEVQRSGISHILSGRNKPSLDFILKVTNVYKDVTIQWLLFGEGEFPPSKKGEQTKQFYNEGDLFTDSNTNKKLEEDKNEQINIVANPTTNSKNISSTPPLHNSQAITANKKVSKIVFFYVDNTFETYYPST